jgi:hypothetical protein
VATLTGARLRISFKRPVLSLLLVVLFWGSSSVPAVAQTEPASPVLNAVVASTTQPGTIMVSGTGFTQGGLVFIVIHDQWGNSNHENRWVVASKFTYQPPQDVDPDEGFSFDTGGNIGEVFELPMPEIEFPSDSQNPALGSVTSQPRIMDGVVCAMSLMVRAYDRSTATWSNVIEVNLGC